MLKASKKGLGGKNRKKKREGDSIKVSTTWNTTKMHLKSRIF